VQAATALFAEGGFEHPTMDEVPCRGGVETTLSYFHGKSALINAVIDELLRAPPALHPTGEARRCASGLSMPASSCRRWQRTARLSYWPSAGQAVAVCARTGQMAARERRVRSLPRRSAKDRTRRGSLLG
jgi:hypothetical protein